MPMMEIFCNFVVEEDNRFCHEHKAKQLWSYAHKNNARLLFREVLLIIREVYSHPPRHENSDIFCLNIPDGAEQTPSAASASVGVISCVSPSSHQTNLAESDTNDELRDQRNELVRLANDTSNVGHKKQAAADAARECARIVIDVVHEIDDKRLHVELDADFQVDARKLRSETENWISHRSRIPGIKIRRSLHAQLGKFLKGVLQTWIKAYPALDAPHSTSSRSSLINPFTVAASAVLSTPGSMTSTRYTGAWMSALESGSKADLFNDDLRGVQTPAPATGSVASTFPASSARMFTGGTVPAHSVILPYPVGSEPPSLAPPASVRSTAETDVNNPTETPYPDES
ncbi:hypothetical protein QFC21_006951 [Naganishia friedmannii]|uniref:Uncharacterized protein n=1 Tax=Naganishia friedmannii TaxID=89922 RepID=A0ACC2UZV5_9TREE|nr:hypothetical protein QFC21_006951 [Naganishia friedmannii]